jgi:hypothetical protein
LDDILTAFGFIKKANEVGMIFDLIYSNYDEFLGDVNKVTCRENVIKFIEVLENYDPFFY